MLACVHAKLLQSCLTLCDPMDHSLAGSSVHRILQTRILEWITMPSTRETSCPGIKCTSLVSPALTSMFFTSSATWEALEWQGGLAQFLNQGSGNRHREGESPRT